MNSIIRKALICAGMLATFCFPVTSHAQQTNPKTGIRWAAAANCETSGFPYVPADGQCEAPGGATTTVPVCVDESDSGTSQSCTTSPTFTPVPGSVIAYIPSTNNSGSSLTENVNSLGAKPVAKWQTTTTLAENDVVAKAVILETYDGTNWELSTIANVPGGGPTGAVLLNPTGEQVIQGNSASGATPLLIVGNGSSSIFSLESAGAPSPTLNFDNENNLNLTSGGGPTPIDGVGGGSIQCGPSFTGTCNIGTNGQNLVIASGNGQLQLLAGKDNGDVRFINMFSTFNEGGIANNGDVVALGGANSTVVDCAVSCANPIGILHSTNGNAIVQTAGNAGVLLDASQTIVVGDLICTSAITAGLGHDNGATPCTSALVGVAVNGSGPTTSATIWLRF